MKQEEIIAQAEKFFIPTYNRLPFILEKGEGSKVWDLEGKAYLDFVSGIAVNALGYNHPRLIKAIEEQVHQILHTSNLYWNLPQIEVARFLAEHTPYSRVFFANSGAEANEGAIKLARKYAEVKGYRERFEIIAMQNSFHGRTLATLAATGQEKFHQHFQPLPAGFKHIPFNDLEAFQKAVDEKTAAIMLEVIQGEGGINVATKEFLQGIADICRKNDILLIADEIQCGMGRTGKFFAFEHFGILPQIVTVAKSFGGGLPLGAVLALEEAALSFTPGDHGSTFGGNPVAAAASKAFLETLFEEKIMEKVQKNGAYFKKGLEELVLKYAFVKEERGLGLMLGLETDGLASKVQKILLEKGVLVNAVNENTLRFLPPLNVKEEEIDYVLQNLDEIFLSLKER